MAEKIRINAFQNKWLDDRGGRTEKDVFRYKDGLYVLMADGYGGRVKVLVPRKAKVDKKVNNEKQTLDK